MISLLMASLLTFVLFLSCEAVPDPAASLAARVALTALADVDASEAALLKEEQDKVASGEFTPLQAGESLHDSLIPHLEAAIFALRHTLAAGVILVEEDLAECAALDVQLNDLRAAQIKEPLFFWHGPRRLVLPRLRRILEAARGQLEALAAEPLNAAASLHKFLGEEGPADPPVAGMEQPSNSALPHGVPTLGVAVGESACGEAGACDIESALTTPEAAKSGALRGVGSAMHLMVELSSQPTLERIGAALQASSAPMPWTSLLIVINELKTSSLKTTVKQSLRHLGLKSFNLLWIPTKGIRKEVWPTWSEELEDMIQTGMIGAYGMHAQVEDIKKLKRLFVGRQPAPIAWLTMHDFLRPINLAVLEAANKFGLAIVATAQPPQGFAIDYLEAAAGREPVAQRAAMYQWILHEGLGILANLGQLSDTGSEADNVPAVLQSLKKLRAPAAAMKLLDTAHVFLEKSVVKADSIEGSPSEESVPLGIEQRLQHFRSLAAQAAARSGGTREGIADAPSAGELIPGVSPAVMQTLDKQARQYKANDHVIYTEDFFDDATFSAMLAETERLWTSTDIEGNCNLDGKNRLGGYVLDHTSHDTSLYKLIYGNEQFRRWVSAVNGMGPMWPSDFPIEIREYGPESAGMVCHSDLQMYNNDKKDCEFAVTIINDSKCNVTYYDAKNVKHEVHTKGNSVMMVRANAAMHCVSLTAGGSRTILKFIYVGDYQKSRSFSSYKVNSCGPGNRNNKMLKMRRERAEL